MNNNFAQRLKQLRQQKGLSQSELAKRVKLHYNHVGRYERGQALPNADALSRLAEEFEVSTDYLMEGTCETAMKVSLHDRDLLKQFQEVETLSEADKHLIKEFLGAFLIKRKLQDLVR